jgi:hypothetical protein
MFSALSRRVIKNKALQDPCAREPSGPEVGVADVPAGD